MKAWLVQIQSMWRGWTIPQKLSIAGAAVLCAVAVVGVGAWSMQSQYVPVAADLSPATAAEIVSALDAAGIQSKLNFSGSSVLVPKQDLSRARLASGKLLDINTSGSENVEGSVWGDPSLNHVRLLRQQEQRLARSITQFEFVRTATVHLSKPEPSPFLRDRQAPSASVVVELKGTNSIGRQDAAAIVSLVAHAVEGLNPDQVTVMDTQGHLLSTREPVDGDVAAQLEYRRRLEADLAIKAETLLAQMLGTGRAIVRVTADLDFNERQTERKTYDPDGKVKVSEKIESESLGSSAPRSTPQSGPPGTGSNVTPAAASSGGSGGGKSERSETTYANAETLEKNREVPGRLVRLTVAAVVQLAEPNVEGQTAAGPAVDAKQVEQLIRQAVGFDDSRNDQISVVTATLAGAVPAIPEVAGVPWDRYEQLARSASLGLAAIVAFLLGLMTLRRLRPTVTVSETTTGESGADQRLAALSMRARENPEAVAQALNAWLATRNSETPATIPMRKAG
ncbi:Flagellar M-ring protein [Caulifigura coniformis]|uniref:Flagellar M-ring protein n=1 Tax=Caulifigura coniformis TaxID=2527983 RepID=A0A517SJL5_9PLAN|nr:flagellar basal-body MS-ring/collar protein FliF [Caulifigura coniformis]QDT56307.1 Flagellar M-ring protein [Caulifigura coniformis]